MGNHSDSSHDLLTSALDSELTKALSWHNCDCECHGMPLSQAKRGMKQTKFWVLPPEGHHPTAFPGFATQHTLPAGPLSWYLGQLPQLSGPSLPSLPHWVTSLPQHLLTPVMATRQSATGPLTEALTISAAASVAGPLVENSMNN